MACMNPTADDDDAAFTDFLHTLRVWDLPELPGFDPDTAPGAPLPSSASGCVPRRPPVSPSRTP